MVIGKTLITGASGLLGKYLLQVARQDSICEMHRNVRGTWCSTAMQDPYCYRLDVTNQVEVERIIGRFGPSVVIHCAAIGSVDYCQQHWQLARDVNVMGTKNVASAARNVGAKFVYVSSNAVYKGTNPPYTEESERVPVNKYGWQKRDAEDSLPCIIGDPERMMIVRPIMLYGWPHPLGRGNWVTRILEWLIQGSNIKLVDDVNTQPTYALDCARAIWSLVQLECSGSWNIGGTDRLSLYQWAPLIAEAFGHVLRPEQIQAVPSTYFQALAPRPEDTTYDLTKLYDLADRHPDHRDALLPRGLLKGLTAMRAER